MFRKESCAIKVDLPYESHDSFLTARENDSRVFTRGGQSEFTPRTGKSHL